MTNFVFYVAQQKQNRDVTLRWVSVLKKKKVLHFFFFFYIFIFLILFNFTIFYRFCHISKWICHRYTCVPHPEPSSLLPPHIIPLGHPSAPAPSIQYRASNLDWWLVSYMILYIFQCHCVSVAWDSIYQNSNITNRYCLDIHNISNLGQV